MPITIGDAPKSDFTNPLGMLSDCHRRIERFLSILAQITEGAHDRELNEDQRAALVAALRYFREAAPRHTLDEEESLFPRMRAHGEACALLDSLHTDHQIAEDLHKGVDALGRCWLEAGQLSSGEAHRLAEMLEELSDIYKHHIALEDSRVSPLAGRLLTPAEVAAIGGEMAARRGIRPLSQWG
ncbi:MAG TPA: hemerythrin domain-containing protein [Blastocatellia bacterium]|nr:hemerythrin domain-containing protein [Blastocatellia bacterium]